MTPTLPIDDELQELPDEEQGESQAPAQQYGTNFRDLPDQLKQAILAAVKKYQGSEKYVRRQEILQDAEHRFYDMGIQHIYCRGDQYYQAMPGTTYNYGGQQESFGEYIDDYDIFNPFAEIQRAKLSENMPGIDFQPVNPNDSDDIEAANAAEGMRHDFDRNNDVKTIQKSIIYHLQMGGRAVQWTWMSDEPEDFDDQGPRRKVCSEVYGCIEAKVPIFAKSQKDFPYIILYDDPDIDIAKTKYSWIAKKLRAGATCLDENAYERSARLGILQGSQGGAYGFRIGDSITHLISRGHIWLRHAAFVDDTDPFNSDDEIEMVPDPETGEERPINVQEKIKELYPRGVHACVVGDQYAESWDQSMDDCISVAHAFIGKGQSRMPIMKSMVIVQDRFNSSMNYVAETNDYCVPSTWVSCDINEFAAIKKQKASPGAFRNMKQLPPGITSVSQAVYHEPGQDIPKSFQEYIEFLYGALPQFQLHVPPSIWGQAMADQKLMDIHEPIPTPSGFVRNGDLRTGDRVFGPDGLTHVILKAHPAQTMEAYRVSFDDGTSVCVHGGHLWHTFTREERIQKHCRSTEFRARLRAKYKPTGTGLYPQQVKRNVDRGGDNYIPKTVTGKVRTTEEILETLTVGTEENKMGVCLNHTIPLSSAISFFPEQNLELDPYCLGAWLGDGSSRGGTNYTATLADGKDILSHFEAAGYPYKKTNRPNDWTIYGLTPVLRKMGVLGDKHIPHIYLWSSEKQRLALLQGLMDTDGNCSRAGRARFSNSNKNISDGVYHLAASLGLKPFRNTVKVSLKGVPCADAHQVEWADTVPVFRLTRKLKGLKPKYSASQRVRYITSIVPVGPMEMRCLTTSNPTGLYLFGRNFNVTHNTSSGYQLAAAQAMGILGAFWMVETTMLANMYYHNCLAIKNEPNYPDEITVPGEGGKNTIVRKASLTKGNFRAYPDSESGFPETTAAKRNTLERTVTQLAATPLAAQILGSPDNVALMVRESGVPELVIPEAVSRDKQVREIDTLLGQSPVLAPPLVQMLQQGADVPSIMQMIKAITAAGQSMEQAQQSQHAAMVIAATATGGQAPPPPPPFDPTTIAKSSVPVWESDYHVWEAKKCRDWLSSDERNTEETIGRPSPDPEDGGMNKPNIAGILNVLLHMKEHDAYAAMEAPPISGPLPTPNMGKIASPQLNVPVPAPAAPMAAASA